VAPAVWFFVVVAEEVVAGAVEPVAGVPEVTGADVFAGVLPNKLPKPGAAVVVLVVGADAFEVLFKVVPKRGAAVVAVEPGALFANKPPRLGAEIACVLDEVGGKLNIDGWAVEAVGATLGVVLVPELGVTFRPPKVLVFGAAVLGVVEIPPKRPGPLVVGVVAVSPGLEAEAPNNAPKGFCALLPNRVVEPLLLTAGGGPAGVVEREKGGFDGAGVLEPEVEVVVFAGAKRLGPEDGLLKFPKRP